MVKPWIVLKFGGTSVASAVNWRQIAERAGELRETHRVWIVASALAGVSNLLDRAVGEALDSESADAPASIRDAHERLADELELDVDARAPMRGCLDELERWLDGIRKTGEAPPRLRARIMATGELASTHLGVAALGRFDCNARRVDARTILRSRTRQPRLDRTHYLEAEVHVADCLPVDVGDEAVVLTQGFIVGTTDGETALLGRGGSDTSAALFAAVLGAERLELWSDVPGLFTADPRRIPSARLIRRIGYREARELAAMGAKVLHPRCLESVSRAGIPVTLHSTRAPERSGTRIESTDEEHPAVTAVTCRSGVTLVTLSTLDMWEEAGFLARVFGMFRDFDVSIDLVATSQSAVSVTLDRLPGGVGGTAFAGLVEQLRTLGRVDVVHPCGVVSIVGRRIRAALHELGPAMQVFQERRVRLVSDSSEDLNLSFVVDEEHAEPLVARLHERLFPAHSGDPRLGASWEVLEGGAAASAGAAPWWRSCQARLCDLVQDGRGRYVYHLPTIADRAGRLVHELRSLDRLFYSMKANSHPAVLQTVAAAGFGIECVSSAEVLRARELLGDDVPILFTPNFCPMDEYQAAFDAGAEVTVDGPEPLLQQPATFRDRSIGVRIDPGRGLGHHAKVLTAGARAKFGQRMDECAALTQATHAAGATVVGLHAHVGSGVLDPGAWARTADALASLATTFDAVEWIDLGGGLGIAERPGQTELDLSEVERSLAGVRRRHPGLKWRMEPGRFLVSEAGVLLAPVTQIRRKGDVRFVGVATGMNSLLRPALYGAWHGIHNLSRLDEPATDYWNVVGPICETSDILGNDRLLPEPRPGDVLLIENAGAYGAVMASNYNQRRPAEEVTLD